MKLTVQSCAALLGLIATVEAARHGHHRHGHAHHGHSNQSVDSPLEKRGGSCEFPSDAGLVAVTPGSKNGGWALSPDQSCEPGSYCPYACPPGQVSMQWDPKATSYSYPQSMNGGLYCDNNGKIQKPFPSKPYCQDGSGAVGARNKCKGEVSFCQTVLPGNEAMLIPTLVSDTATLAVPDPSYWCETAAHFYINPPGYDAATACVWGTSSNPYGNWSPYVAGANTDNNGNTFLKIGWNPIYLEPATPFRNTVPDFGVEIECEGDGCNGLPCKIDPAVNKVNEMVGSTEDGAGGASFCVVTVPKGEKANIVVFESGGDSSGGGDDDDDDEPETSSTIAPTTSSTTVPSSTSSAESSSTSSSAESTSTAEVIPTATPTSTRKPTSKVPYSHPPLFASPSYTYKPGILIETGGSGSGSASAMETQKPEPSEVPEENNGQAVRASLLSLIVGVFAAIL